MNLALVAIVLAIGAGAVVAVSTRETAAAAIGLAVALVASALFADPLPSASILGVRVVAALLAAALIRWAGQGATRQYSALGWPGEALLATAGAVAGLGVAVGLAAVGIGAAGPGGDVASDGLASSAVTAMALLVGAGCSLLVLGVGPLVHGPLGIRRAMGLVLVTEGVLLVRVGLAGQATALEEVARALLLVTAAATGGALARAAALERGGGNPDDEEVDAEERAARTGGDRVPTSGSRQAHRAPGSR
jgi:hypothetical protein